MTLLEYALYWIAASALFLFGWCVGNAQAKSIADLERYQERQKRSVHDARRGRDSD